MYILARVSVSKIMFARLKVDTACSHTATTQPQAFLKVNLKKGMMCYNIKIQVGL